MNACPEIREILELATVEPGGLDRLMAGDTPESVAAAGHLAGCAACAEELARLYRADGALRPIFATMGASDLRERVLAQVRTVGRDRGTGAEASPVEAASTGSAAAAVAGDPLAGIPLAIAVDGRSSDALGERRPVSAAGATTSAGASRRRRAWWPAAVAAALVIGLLGGAVAGRQMAPAAPDSSGSIALAEVSRETATLMAAPDAQSVVLRDSSGVPRGTLVAARSVGRIVVMATDLPAPGPGHEYRCWVETNGARTGLGRMWLDQTVAWWSGPAALPSGDAATMRYGVSLASTEGASGQPQAVLTGP